jgi:uncharacterized HAD superfamily protein
MSKPTIAVDIDEVLFPMAPTFLDYHNTTHGTTITLDQMVSYYLEDITGETIEEVIEKIKAYLDSEHYSSGTPIKGSVEAISKLRQRFRLVLITSRNDFYRGYTEDFIEKHFGGLFDELRYTHEIENPTATIPKHVICKELGAMVLIDDHLHNVVECVKAGVDAILFGSYPWNQANALPKGLVRLNDWQEVLEYFDGKTTE